MNIFLKHGGIQPSEAWHYSCFIPRSANGIVSLKWPGNSPDLILNENLWRIVGKELDKDKPKSKNNLTHSILHVWHQKIMLGTLQSLVESMPRRLEVVIKAKGGSTKY